MITFGAPMMVVHAMLAGGGRGFAGGRKFRDAHAVPRRFLDMLDRGVVMAGEGHVRGPGCVRAALFDGRRHSAFCSSRRFSTSASSSAALRRPPAA